MRRHGTHWLWLVLLAGCTAGEDGGTGLGAVPCSAAPIDGGWQIQCPDGSSATVQPGACVEQEGAAGERILRCPDGTEAVIRDREDAAPGAVAGIASLQGRGPADGVLVEILGTSLQATSSLDGSFVVTGIPNGRYDVRLSRPPFREVVVQDVRILPGTWELGAVELAFGGARREAEHAAVHPESQRAIFYGAPRYEGEVVDLVTGERVARIPHEVDYAHWIDGAHLWVEGWQRGTRFRGIYEPETEALHLWTDWNQLSTGPGAVLTRPAPGATLRIRWTDGETDLGHAPSGNWSQVHRKAVWLINGADGVWVIDGASRTMRQLEPGFARSAAVDGAASLVRIEATVPGGTQLIVHDLAAGTRHDLGTWTSLPQQEFEDRTFVWWDDDAGATAILAGRPTLRTFPGATAIPSPGPSGLVFAVPTATGGRLESRDGSWHHLLAPGGAFARSPDGTRVALVENGPLLRIIDAESGQARTWPLPTEEPALDWLNEGDLALHLPDASLHVRWDGQVLPLGGRSDVEVAGDTLLARPWDDSAAILFDLRTGASSALDAAETCHLVPNGRWLACVGETGSLRLRNAADGTSYRLARSSGLQLLDDVVVYSPPSQGGYPIHASVPYP